MLDRNKIIANLDGRQHGDWIYFEATVAQFLANGNVLSLEVPPLCEVVGGHVNVVTASDEGTTDTISVGDAGSAARYHAAIDFKTVARTSLTATGYQYTAQDNHILITRTPVGTAATVGTVRIAIQTIQLGEAAFTQG